MRTVYIQIRPFDSRQVDIYLMGSIIGQFDSLEESHEYVCFTSAGERSGYYHKN